MGELSDKVDSSDDGHSKQSAQARKPEPFTGEGDMGSAAKKSAKKRRRAAAAAAVAAAANTESLSGGSADADSDDANATGADKGADRFAQLEAER
ncbi:TPA: hypothetical protein ACH3X2_010535 [Trebouxia sp. C0005]